MARLWSSHHPQGYGEQQGVHCGGNELGTAVGITLNPSLQPTGMPKLVTKALQRQNPFLFKQVAKTPPARRTQACADHAHQEGRQPGSRQSKWPLETTGTSGTAKRPLEKSSSVHVKMVQLLMREGTGWPPRAGSPSSLRMRSSKGREGGRERQAAAGSFSSQRQYLPHRSNSSSVPA